MTCINRHVIHCQGFGGLWRSPVLNSTLKVRELISPVSCLIRVHRTVVMVSNLDRTVTHTYNADEGTVS